MYSSLVRSLVPLLAGLVITQALRLGVHLDQGTVTDVVQAVVTGLYYTAFRWAEVHLGPGWGWFLGLARPPKYPAASHPLRLPRPRFLRLAGRRSAVGEVGEGDDA